MVRIHILSLPGGSKGVVGRIKDADAVNAHRCEDDEPVGGGGGAEKLPVRDVADSGRDVYAREGVVRWVEDADAVGIMRREDDTYLLTYLLMNDGAGCRGVALPSNFGRRFPTSQRVTTLHVLAARATRPRATRATPPRATHGQARRDPRGAVVPRVPSCGAEAVDPGERVGEGVARRAALAERPARGASVPCLQYVVSR